MQAPEITPVEVGKNDDGTAKMLRVMTPAQILERDRMNVENTATRLRARVVAEVAAMTQEIGFGADIGLLADPKLYNGNGQ